MLVTFMVGFEARSTMDIDATINGETVNIEEVRRIIEDIILLDLSDGVRFTVNGISEIMDESEYFGVRVAMVAYNLETVLAEKLETIIARTTANTRMRDFYDIYILLMIYWKEINPAIMTDALLATSRKRGSLELLNNTEKVLTDLHDSRDMEVLWGNYRSKFSYAKSISWEAVLWSVRELAVFAGLQQT